MPAERVAERERYDRVPYQDWIDRGFIEATPGNSVDQTALKECIQWAAQAFQLREVCFDPWNFRVPASEMQGEGLECVEIRQAYSMLSEPTKLLLSLYLDGKIRHANNPVLNWNASCLALQSDRKDNVQPAKPERGKSNKRIDGISAIITALARAATVAGVPTKQPLYERRGMRWL
jgi:phage terminase large subunit-like protein